MERRINKKINEFLGNYKTEVKDYILSCKDNIDGTIDNWDGKDTESMTSLKNIVSGELMTLLQQIYDHPNISLIKEDFTKRKRVKNIVPFFDRCIACRASQEQCTRRKKDKNNFCGTHIKGTPHGIIKEHKPEGPIEKKVNVCVRDIKGIMYYIDNDGNVYDTEECMGNQKNPKIIAKYIKTMVDGESEYSIPAFNI